jgi:hypothetical protein
MKKLLMLLLLCTSSAFAGPKYAFDDPHLDDEMDNNYKEHTFPNWVYARGSSATIKYLTVSSETIKSVVIGTMTVSLATISSAAITNLTVPTLIVGTINGSAPSSAVILQSVYSTISASSSTLVTSFIPTNCKATITPTSSSSKINVLVHGLYEAQTGAAGGELLYDDFSRNSNEPRAQHRRFTKMSWIQRNDQWRLFR